MECVFFNKFFFRVVVKKVDILTAHLFSLQLVGKGEFGSLLLKLGKFVFVLGDLLEGWLDELALHVTDGDGELVDLEVAEDDLSLEEEHLGLQLVPLVEVLLADLLEVVDGGVVDVGLGSATLGNDTESLLGFALLLLLELLSGLFTEKSSELLLTLWGHESLLLGHDEIFLRDGAKSTLSYDCRDRSAPSLRKSSSCPTRRDS